MQHSLQWSAGFSLVETKQSGTSVEFVGEDQHRGMRLITTVSLDANTTVASFCSRVENTGQTALHLSYLNAASLPLPTTVDKIKTFEGRWSAEFQTSDHDLFFGSYVRENRRGKPPTTPSQV